MEKGIEAGNAKPSHLRGWFRALVRRHFRLLSWIGLGVWILTMYALLHILRSGF